MPAVHSALRSAKRERDHFLYALIALHFRHEPSPERTVAAQVLRELLFNAHRRLIEACNAAGHSFPSSPASLRSGQCLQCAVCEAWIVRP